MRLIYRRYYSGRVGPSLHLLYQAFLSHIPELRLLYLYPYVISENYKKDYYILKFGPEHGFLLQFFVCCLGVIHQLLTLNLEKDTGVKRHRTGNNHFSELGLS